MKTEFRNDDSIPSYGMWMCRSCKNEFYGGGPALHKRGCRESGYDSCTFVYGPKTQECGQALLPVPKHQLTFQ